MSKAKARDLYLQRTYPGMNSEKYEKLLKLQGGVCAICGRKPKKGKRLHVDHDHKTQVVRGLLDFYCNKRVLGRHTVDSARRILAYLERGIDGRNL